MTSPMTSPPHFNLSSAAIQLTEDRGHLALYPGPDTSSSDWTLSSCYWSVEAPAGRTIVVAWKISLGGWTMTDSSQGHY